MYKKSFKYSITAFGTILFLLLFVPLFVSYAGTSKYKTLSDFKGKKISILNGTSFDGYIEENEILQGNVDILYQNSDVDSVLSVLNKKSDALVNDAPICEMIVSQHDELIAFPELICEDNFGFGFKKGNPLVNTFNDAMSKLEGEGLTQEMKDKWLGDDESEKVLIPQDWPGKNGTLRFWTSVSAPPMSYLGPEGAPIGYAIDYMLHVAREMDYKVEVVDCSFDGLIPALQGGKADIVGDSMSITEERLKTIDFSNPYYVGGATLVVRKEDVDPALLSEIMSQDTTSKDGAFIGSIKKSFKRTFIESDRWQIFAKGLLTTITISLASMVFGLILGFALFMLCRKTGETVHRIVNVIAGVIVGIPSVVLLMVLFYIIFAKTKMSGMTVAIITFTLTFGISVLQMLETGTDAVDPGQTEGAYALGFSDNETFFRVILPQAVMHILPIFKGELSSLVKATAVVGYVAVQDLTRAGDMVRNRTFEAFFSLISVAIIYYVLGKLLSFIIDRIQVNYDPKHRTKEQILKGVETHD